MLTKIFTATVLSVGVSMSATASTQTSTHLKQNCNPYLKSCQAGSNCYQTQALPDCCKTNLACCEQALQLRTAEHTWVENLNATRLAGNAFLIERPLAHAPPC
ncbi:MAG: hypothetical protein CME32_20225 [Gimesia sp.]|nr:hypothetical protein [Gimesia sp.]MCR9234078.1 hypothetical protein [bacterium]